MDIRRKFSPGRVVRPWPRMPREVLEAPSLKTLKVNLLQSEMSLLTEGGWTC